MRNPITDIAGHLSWTDSGIVWATWRIEALAYGRRPLKDKRTVRDVHRLLLRCLDGEALLLGVAVALDPVAVVERQISGVVLDTCPDLAAEAEANLDRLGGLVLGERAFFLSVPLANHGRRRWSAPLAAAMGTFQDLAQLPRAHPSEDELQARVGQAAAIEKLIPAPFRPRPVGAAEQVWLAAHAVRRGMADFPPPDAGSLDEDLIVQSGICLPEPILDEGAWADLDAGVKVRNPMARRVLKVVDPRGTDLGQPASYQCPMVLTDTPIGGLTWPGSELLASLDDVAHDVDWAIRLRVNAREKVMAANRKALRELNDQYDQRSDETTLGSSDLDHAAELLAEYQTIFSSDRLEVEVEHTVILTVAGPTAESAMEQATALATALANADFRLERPVGALTELWWATQIGVPSSRSVRGWSMFTSAGRFSALVPFTSTQLGGRQGHVWGLNTSSSRTSVIHLDPGGYPELDKSGSMAWAGELGSGKALPLDTLIPTPSGWAQMGDLAPGDEVFDEQGRPTMVLWTSPVMTDHTCYEVTFSDGSMLVADAEHLWTTLPDRTRSRAAKQNFKARARGAVDLINLTIYTADLTGPGWPSKGTTLSTEEIRATLHRGVQANHAIPVAGALALPVVALPIDPYVLGAWLGDGTSTAPYLTTADPEILTFIEAAGYDISKLTDRYGYAISLPNDEDWQGPDTRSCPHCEPSFVGTYPRARYCSHSCSTSAIWMGAPPQLPPTCSSCQKDLGPGSSSRRCSGCRAASTLRGRLRLLGVLGRKNIPPIYLRASIGQRQALLAGLLDTDGTVAAAGQVQLDNTNRQLARDVHELANSLGYRASIREGRARLNGRDCGPTWTVSFTTTDDVFRLTRKSVTQRERRTTESRVRHTLRYIVAVREVRSVPVRCIRVAAESRLFLAGRSMIPTHNTYSMKTAATAIVDMGGQLMTIDKSNEGEWARFAATFAGAVIVDPSDPAWSMDPLRCMGFVDGSSVAQSFISQLLNLSPQEDEGITLAQVLDPGYLTSYHLQGLQDVMEHLEGGCPLAGAQSLGRRLRNYANSPLGRLVLDQGLPPVDGTSDVIVWRTHSMEQPTNEEIATPHLFRALPITKVFGRAYYSLVTSTARRWAFADTSRVSALVCDEAYDIFSNPENGRDLEHFVRQGRRPKALLLLGSHNPDRDFGTETMRSLIPTRIVMRQTDVDLARASVRWLGIAEDDPEFEVMVDQLRFQTAPAMPDRGVEPARRGECFIRDAFGGIGSAKILGPALPARLAAVSSTPPKSKRATA